jgi:hypothetical protein
VQGYFLSPMRAPLAMGKILTLMGVWLEHLRY